MIVLTPQKRTLFFILFDLFISLVSLYMAYQLRFNFEIDAYYFDTFFRVFFVLAFLKVFALYLFKIYHVPWRFFSLNEVKKLVGGHMVALALFLVLFMVTSWFDPMPRSVIVIDFFISILLVGFLRISKRLVIERAQTSQTPTLIFGANSKAQQIIQSYLHQDSDYYPIAIIDDEQYQNTYFSNVPVFSSHKIERLIEQYSIQSAILTHEVPQHFLNHLMELGIYNIQYYRLVGNKENFQEISIEDLLARHPKDLDNRAVKDFIEGKVVAITGAGGSIGSELTQQVIAFGAQKVILIDHSEFNLYQLSELIASAACQKIFVLESITRREKITELFLQYHPDLVLHAAAYKHVPLCESNPTQAIENNVFGSMNVIDAAIGAKVQKLVIISTDKAVRPTNVMGATKRVVELYAQNVSSKETHIAAVRFGNVLGSSGSVIPKFKEQIKNGGPITVTHPEITRYFMLISEACQLVLQAASIAHDKELFILDMGEPVKIAELAQKMIQLSRKPEIKIEFSGLRAGEKLYEELLIDENDKQTKYESIFIAPPTAYDFSKLLQDIHKLRQTSEPIKALQVIVPEFNHQSG